VAGEYGVLIQPHKDILLLKGLYKGYVSELEMRISELEQENSYWFNESGNYLAVLNSQGKVIRMNQAFSEFAGAAESGRDYLWDMPVFEKSESDKHELRQAIRELSESNNIVTISKIVSGGKLHGILDKRNQINSILVIIPETTEKD
jgi:PAS domain-containing protein